MDSPPPSENESADDVAADRGSDRWTCEATSASGGRSRVVLFGLLVAAVLCAGLIALVANHLGSRGSVTSADAAAARLEAPDVGLRARSQSGMLADAASPSGRISPDQLVAARTPTGVVLATDLDDAVDRLAEGARLRGVEVDEAWRERQRAELLERRIDEQLLRAHLAERSARLPESSVERRLTERARAFGDGEHARAQLAEALSTTVDALRREIRFELALEEALDAHADEAEHTAPDPHRIHAEEEALFRAPERAVIDIIALSSDGDGRRVAATREGLVRGHAASDVARRVHGRLEREGWLATPADLGPELVRFAFATPPDDANQDAPRITTLRSGKGVRVVRVRKVRAAGSCEYSEVQEAVALAATRRRRERARASLLEELRASSDIVRYDAQWHRRLHRRIMGDAGGP